MALNRVPFILLSGGLDSEVLVKAFLEAQVPFEAISFRYLNGLNKHEVNFIEAFKARHKFAHRYLDIDVLDWYKSDEVATLFRESQCVSVAMIPHMKLMSYVHTELNGFPVLGNGDVYLEKQDGQWQYVELEYMLAWYRHAQQNNIQGEVGFFQSSAELTLAMLREPKIERLGRNEDLYATRVYDTSRFIKYAIYRKHWPDLVMRPKFEGHELVHEQFKMRSLELLDSPALISKCALDYETLLAGLEPDSSKISKLFSSAKIIA